MSSALSASELALQREHRLSSLGALVAAYAHELGTPLATIRLAATDLLQSALPKESREDAELILAESKRSAEILNSMGSRGKADELVQILPLQALIEEAAAPHMNRGIIVEIQSLTNDEIIYVRRSEVLIQALRNLIQNAVDFAKSKVEIDFERHKGELLLRIRDDGNGFSNEALSKLGEPYLKVQNQEDRDGRASMGLGIFIAQTLLERSHAKLTMRNASSQEGKGAIVLIEWPLADIEVDKTQARAALRENQVISE